VCSVLITKLLDIHTMKLLKISPLLLALSLAVSHTQAAVILQDTFSYISGVNEFPTELDGVGTGTWGYEISTAGFSAAGNGKLVFAYSSKDEQGGDIGGALFTSVSFNGASLTEAISTENFNRGTAGVWYLDNVASNGIIRILLADQNNSEFGFGLYALDGLKAGFQDTASGNLDAEATVTVGTSSGFVVQEAVRNNQNLTPDGTDDWLTLNDTNVQSYTVLQQYQVTTAAGDYFAPTNNTATKLVIGAAFEEAIPEPSVALLGALGSVLLLRRRR